MLKLGIAFFPWLLVAAIVIEAGDSGPRSISGSLPGLRVERFGKRVCFSKLGTGTLQIIPIGATSVHPEAKTFVAHKLRGSDRLLDGAILGVGPVKLVLVDQQHRPFCFPPSLFMCTWQHLYSP